MKILELKQAILLCRAATFLEGAEKRYVTPWIWGHCGLGKSSLVEQVCKFKRWGFIDFRASQIEAADLRGLPDKELNEDGEPIRTIFLPPSDMPIGQEDGSPCPATDPTIDVDEFHEQYGGKKQAQPFYNEGILFLDELPRAEDDVIQAAFQLVIEGAVGSYTLPPGWTMVVAGNYLEGYQQNDFQDPAWLSRFTHLTLDASKQYKQEWFDFIISRYPGKNANRVMQFVGFDTKHLMGNIKGDLGFTVNATPRTWEYALRVLEASEKMDDIPDKVVYDVVAGLVGRDLAKSFQRFSVDVMPDDILDRGLDGTRHKLSKLNRNQLVGLVWGVVSACREREKKAEWMENALDFMEWIAGNKSQLTNDARDLAVSFGRQLYATETDDEFGVAMLSNPTLAKLAVKFNKGNPLSWVSRIHKREKLSKLMSKVSWGM